MNRHLPEPQSWPIALRRRRRPSLVTAATLRAWRAAGLDPATIAAVLQKAQVAA